MIELLKEIALEAADRGSMADFCTGTVVAAAPLSIQMKMAFAARAVFTFEQKC